MKKSVSQKYCHHQIYALTEEFNLTRYWGFFASGSNENSCHRNALPGRITDAAWLFLEHFVKKKCTY